MTNDEVQALVTGITQAVLERMEQRFQSALTANGLHTSRITLPQTIVNNEVKSPEVVVHNSIQLEPADPVPVTVNNHIAPADLTPMVNAITQMTQLVVNAMEQQRQAQEGFEAMMSQLLQVLADRPAIKFRPTINLPEPRVNVRNELPAFNGEPRRRRALTITHQDGTTSTVTED